jgi:DNA-binding MarR family transcriptional regulator
MMDMSTADLDVLDALRDLRRALSHAAAGAFAGTGIGPRQAVVMRELRHGGSASQADLSRATATDPAAMMRALDVLERRGWVLRSSCEVDRRRKLVSLTAEGRRALAAVDEGYDALRAVTNDGLSSAERRQFCAIAAKLTVRMNEAGAAAPAEEEP